MAVPAMPPGNELPGLPTLLSWGSRGRTGAPWCRAGTAPAAHSPPSPPGHRAQPRASPHRALLLPSTTSARTTKQTQAGAPGNSLMFPTSSRRAQSPVHSACPARLLPAHVLPCQSMGAQAPAGPLPQGCTAGTQQPVPPPRQPCSAQSSTQPLPSAPGSVQQPPRSPAAAAYCPKSI